MSRGMGMAESGFTLIEVLVSMSIGIVLIYLLTETLTATQTGWLRASLLGQTIELESRSARILRHTLSHLLPPAPDGREHALKASNQSFEFFTLPPQSRSGRGPLRGRLAIEAESGGLFALVLTLEPANEGGAPPMEATRHVLRSGLASAHISYYYAGTDTVSIAPPRSDVVPELVLVSWSSPDRASDVMEVAVRPRLSVSGRCHLDLTSGTCRIL